MFSLDATAFGHLLVQIVPTHLPGLTLNLTKSRLSEVTRRPCKTQRNCSCQVANSALVYWLSDELPMCWHAMGNRSVDFGASCSDL
eukprot:4858190-Amphidinium_carterae.1